MKQTLYRDKSGRFCSKMNSIPCKKHGKKKKPVKPLTLYVSPTKPKYTESNLHEDLDFLEAQTIYHKKRNDINKLRLNLYNRKAYGTSFSRALRIKELSLRVFNDIRALNEEDITILNPNKV